MTDPAKAAMYVQHADTPLGAMSPAQLARYALRTWALCGDRLHELHTGWEEWQRAHDHCGRPIDIIEPGNVDQPYTASWLQRHSDYSTEVDFALRQMSFWLQLAQTAADVARLPDDGQADPEPVSVAGYDLAAARAWFEQMAAQGEGDQPVSGRAAQRWRTMSPDQRAACRAMVQEMLSAAGAVPA